MKKVLAVMSAVSFMLFALVDFGKNALETYLHIQLINGAGNFASSDYLVDAQMCQTLLLVIGIVCIVMFIVSFFVEKRSNPNKI